eukprot:g16640.t1
MKRARGGGRTTGHPTPFQPTTTAATSARSAALGRYHRVGSKLAMASMAVWCAAASSAASAATAGGIRRGAYHTGGAFLYGSPLGRQGATCRGVQPSAPVAVARRAWWLLGVFRHEPAGGSAHGCKGAFAFFSGVAGEHAPGVRLPAHSWRPSLSSPSSPGGGVMPAAFRQNSSFHTSSAVGRLCSSSSSSSSSRAFFGSGSSSRTAARKRRERRQATLATKREESSRRRSQREAAAAAVRGSGAGGASAETTEAVGVDGNGTTGAGQAAAAEGGRGGGEDVREELEQRQEAGALPYGTAYHVPVVCEEVLEWLVTDPEGWYVDCTLGGGGHSAALLASLDEGARVIGLDRDPAALREASKRLAAEADAGRFQAVRSNFADVGRAVRDCELLRLPEPEPDGSSGSSSVLVDGILVDLGVSSHQIDDGARGFSFSADGPLDMRMEGGSGSRADEGGRDAGAMEDKVGGPLRDGEGGGWGREDGGCDGGSARSAHDVVNFADEMEIREMVWRYGDEKRSTKIARVIVENRPIETTKQLAEVVGKCAPPKERVKTLARVFQALRIEVNGELDALEALLEQAKHLVRPGGRLLILSYHSLEDRRVKRVLASGNLKGKIEKDFYGNVLSPWKPLLRKPLMAGEAEVALNPRARSVRLRVAERTDLP